jgi:hypothetical protein
MQKPIQFNWRRHWSRKVAPHLGTELVQASLDLGMSRLDPRWRRGDPPYLLGAIPLWRTRVVRGKLSWYRPWNRCHWIAFFSMAIGVVNYPELDWRFVSGERHTVPVGYGPDGEPRVVMDVLLFGHMTAEESIAHAGGTRGNAAGGCGWDEVYRSFAGRMASVACGLLGPRRPDSGRALRADGRRRKGKGGRGGRTVGRGRGRSAGAKREGAVKGKQR